MNINQQRAQQAATMKANNDAEAARLKREHYARPGQSRPARQAVAPPHRRPLTDDELRGQADAWAKLMLVVCIGVIVAMAVAMIAALS
ncbi:hypothetical protein MO973_09545 [Paenibacillus sp. TRM 82003]|uniref:hypothetical protein n=1 Tax=Kineococcus sp. TRM81007 TaxID=2925831 RepID=UPI001F57AFE1|nr:hypothetical protein [Kineococcus sp. TRM81007]MCI2238092.1 hypothetical protein [Kineococcus sp. TRM81007]MCI3920476.1 hypothetical protein [Paenibacillus sp. TRM 82003]